MKHLTLILATVLMVGCTSVATTPYAAAAEHPDARPFDKTRNASADVDAALAQGAAEDKVTLVVMGANWCHDSRALGGWFETEEFQTLLNEHFVVTYVDVARKNRNIDIAQRFGIEEIVGTPTLIMVGPDGSVLNLETAPTWRNSASRSKDEILTELETVAGL